MDSHQTAEMEAVQDKQKEVEGFCGPIISKLYQVKTLTKMLPLTQPINVKLFVSQETEMPDLAGMNMGGNKKGGRGKK